MSKEKENEIVLFENKKIILLRDSRNWIVVRKDDENKRFYFSDIMYFFSYLVKDHLTDKIIEQGLINALNSLNNIHRDIKREVSTIVDALATISKKMEDEL